MYILRSLTVLASLVASSNLELKRQIQITTVETVTVTITPSSTLGSTVLFPTSDPASASSSSVTNLSTSKSSSTSSTSIKDTTSSPSSKSSSSPTLTSSSPASSITIITTKASGTIALGTKYQTIEGFGFSEAFGSASSLQYFPGSTQKVFLDYLFSTKNGSGMTIIRNGIGSSAGNVSNMLSILRQPPLLNGAISPNGTANYTWDGSDNGQVWFTQQAQAYGEMTVIADAWSAPPFMKTNNEEIYAGYICGVSGTDCTTGDWRQAYANYLVQYIKFYAEEGISIKYIGFLNEPDLTEPYPSMGSSGTQAADFIKILYPTLKAANLTTGISCCDASGWYAQSIMMPGMASVENEIGIITAHPYSTQATFSLTTLHQVWQTEWSNQKGDNYTTDWYSGTGNAGEGLIWATNIYNGLTTGNCSAYLYWQGAQLGEYRNTMLVSVNFDGTLTIPKRYWAFAQYSRWVRPGAVRVATTSSTTNIKISAFQNLDGSLAIQTINSGASNYSMTLTINGLTGKTATSWLTDNNNNLTASDGKLVSDTSITGSIPPYSLVSFIVS